VLIEDAVLRVGAATRFLAVSGRRQFLAAVPGLDPVDPQTLLRQ
jgi:hypothetical protein